MPTGQAWPAWMTTCPADVRNAFPAAVDEVELQGEGAPALDPRHALSHGLPRAHQRTDVVGIEGRSSDRPYRGTLR
jgi:hypothetical protein